MANYDIVVMGDINLDWVCRGDLAYTFASLASNGVIEWREIDELPGGSGLNFANFARRDGYRTFLIGKLGQDPAGDFLGRWLEANQLAEGVCTSTLRTGKAFIARDKNDVRFLVNNKPNSNGDLSIEDVNQFADIISRAQVLYISGYCVMNPKDPRTRATRRALEVARRGGQTRIIFDVVPHQIYNIYSFDEFKELLGRVDILISEVATVRRFLGLGDKHETITKSMVEEALRLLKDHYPAAILRFGPSGCDYQAICDGEQVVFEETGHAQAQDKRGHGDRMALRAFRSTFGIHPKNPDRL